MTDSASNSLLSDSDDTQNVVASSSASSSSKGSCVPGIPIEIVTDEEMAFMEAALAAARSSLSSSSSSFPSIFSSSSRRYLLFRTNVRSIRSVTALSKRRPSGGVSEFDVEDSGDLRSTQKKNRPDESFLRRFRSKRGLSVTDITATEWCEKSMEFTLLFGKKFNTKAMKAGSARHQQLEEEVVKRVRVRTKSAEDAWAVKFLNFIIGAEQFLLEGLTREFPLVGFVEGVWMVGIVDELRMPEEENNRNPILVDTKTRVGDSLPSEPQRRNGRLQLMCYKYLYDIVVANKLPLKEFCDSFSLDPTSILSKKIREHASKAGIPAETLEDMVRYYRNACTMMLPANNQMILRYESQKDNSVLGEDHFTFDPDLLKSQIRHHLEFWMGKRDASYVPKEEHWKCRYCRYASACSRDTISDVLSSHPKTADPL